MTDSRSFARSLEEKRAGEARRLDAARREQSAAGKEAFCLHRLEAIYDTTNESGYRDPDPAVRAARWEYKYYVVHPAVRSIEEFVAARKELDGWRT